MFELLLELSWVKLLLTLELTSKKIVDITIYSNETFTNKTYVV